MNTVTHLDTDDYLDLYLFAKKIGDTFWQKEIMVKLREVINGQPAEKEKFDLDDFLENN